MRGKLLAFAAVLTMAVGAEAALSKAAEEWRRGPDKFLMTKEEEKEWKAVTTDAAAAEFIDLFWARRDPTPGTSRNEFREEFLQRVRYADSAFAEKRRRGALSDRGQVYILLGPPDEGTRGTMSIQGPAAMSNASARSSDSLVWTWSREAAVALGVPKLAASFHQLVGTDTYARDPEFGSFSNISSAAARKSISNATLTSVPEWATRVSSEVFVAAPVPRAEAKAKGRIGRLVLLRNLDTLNLDASADPIASLQPAAKFAVDDVLAFVLEYCGAPGPLKVETKIKDLAASSEVEPSAMKAVAGCGVIADMMSLSDLKPGAYELEITTEEPGGGRLSTRQRFQLE